MIDRSKYCSNTCFRASKNTQILYNCDFCHKPFMVRKSKVEDLHNGKYKNLYCSKICSQNAARPKWEDVESLFNSKGYQLISKEYISAKEKLKYMCPKHESHGIQEISYDSLKSGFGCKYCGFERTADVRRLTFEQVKEIFARHDMDLLEQPYVNTSQKLAYICRHHPNYGIQYMSTSNAYKEQCPHCRKSKGESKISSYLLSHNIKFESQKKYPDLLGEKQQLSYDFYLPDFNLLIEYQGEQHEKPKEVFGGEVAFSVQQEHDLKKREYAKSNNIQLLEIWYYDYKNIDNILYDEISNII